MKLNLSRKGLGIILGLSLASGGAFASTIGGGEFSASGTVFVSTTALDFGTSSLPPPGDQHASINLPTTGAFSYLTYGTLIGMSNLNLAAATTVSGTDINFDGAEPMFITLPADMTGTAIDLSLTDIPINTGVPVCSGTAADDVQGTECRAYAASPIVLEQGPSGVTAILNLQGDAYYAGGAPASGSPYDGKLSADFTGTDGTITGLLGTFTSTGSVTTGFSATFSTVPEPGTVTALGIGLLAIGLFNKKKRSSKKSV